MTIKQLSMLNSKKLPMKLWVETVSTVCYIINRVHMRQGMRKTLYEIWLSKKSNLSHFHIFGNKCYFLNDIYHLGKFDSKSDEGVFLGYSNNSRTYLVYNMTTQIIIKSANMVVDDTMIFRSYLRRKK